MSKIYKKEVQFSEGEDPKTLYVKQRDGVDFRTITEEDVGKKLPIAKSPIYLTQEDIDFIKKNY